ncbi:centriole, cilia and spindle-associated protein isoform X2 [Cebidichthys violaceus]|uniref:centriole, cilia and spindle-associated protein isoform X2 n=1 Tax=Cebidichthys violaceus TaxID=271503 RepID=UPI0035CCA23F
MSAPRRPARRTNPRGEEEVGGCCSRGKPPAALPLFKMVTKRIRSEYMKKFKDPKWETYTKCYEEMLKYRLTRRLLEHTHNPWFWSGSDSDSDSAGRSPPPPSKNQGLSLKVPERQKYQRRRERSRLTVKTERETLEEPDHSRVNPPNPQSKHGVPSGSGLHQHGRPGTTVRTADILLLCMVQERRMPTRQAGRHTMLALQLLLLRSTSQLFVLRSDGRWSVRCRPRRLSGEEPSLPIWTRPESWFNQNSTPGSLSTCAASLLAHDRTLKHTHTLKILQGDSRQK